MFWHILDNFILSSNCLPIHYFAYSYIKYVILICLLISSYPHSIIQQCLQYKIIQQDNMRRVGQHNQLKIVKKESKQTGKANKLVTLASSYPKTKQRLHVDQSKQRRQENGISLVSEMLSQLGRNTEGKIQKQQRTYKQVNKWANRIKQRIYKPQCQVSMIFTYACKQITDILHQLSHIVQSIKSYGEMTVSQGMAVDSRNELRVCMNIHKQINGIIISMVRNLNNILGNMRDLRQLNKAGLQSELGRMCSQWIVYLCACLVCLHSRLNKVQDKSIHKQICGVCAELSAMRLETNNECILSNLELVNSTCPSLSKQQVLCVGCELADVQSTVGFMDSLLQTICNNHTPKSPSQTSMHQDPSPQPNQYMHPASWFQINILALVKQYIRYRLLIAYSRSGNDIESQLGHSSQYIDIQYCHVDKLVGIYISYLPNHRIVSHHTLQLLSSIQTLPLCEPIVHSINAAMWDSLNVNTALAGTQSEIITIILCKYSTTIDNKYNHIDEMDRKCKKWLQVYWSNLLSQITRVNTGLADGSASKSMINTIKSYGSASINLSLIRVFWQQVPIQSHKQTSYTSIYDNNYIKRTISWIFQQLPSSGHLYYKAIAYIQELIVAVYKGIRNWQSIEGGKKAQLQLQQNKYLTSLCLFINQQFRTSKASLIQLQTNQIKTYLCIKLLHQLGAHLWGACNSDILGSMYAQSSAFLLQRVQRIKRNTGDANADESMFLFIDLVIQYNLNIAQYKNPPKCQQTGSTQHMQQELDRRMCGNNIYSPPLNKAVEQIARDLKICDSDMLQQICKKIISMWVRLKLSIDNQQSEQMQSAQSDMSIIFGYHIVVNSIHTLLQSNGSHIHLLHIIALYCLCGNAYEQYNTYQVLDRLSGHFADKLVNQQMATQVYSLLQITTILSIAKGGCSTGRLLGIMQESGRIMKVSVADILGGSVDKLLDVGTVWLLSWLIIDASQPEMYQQQLQHTVGQICQIIQLLQLRKATYKDHTFDQEVNDGSINQCTDECLYMVKKRIRDIERMVIDIVAVYVLDRLCRTLTKYTHVDKQVYSTIGNILIINKYIQALTKQRTYSQFDSNIKHMGDSKGRRNYRERIDLCWQQQVGMYLHTKLLGSICSVLGQKVSSNKPVYNVLLVMVNMKKHRTNKQQEQWQNSYIMDFCTRASQCLGQFCLRNNLNMQLMQLQAKQFQNYQVSHNSAPNLATINKTRIMRKIKQHPQYQ